MFESLPHEILEQLFGCCTKKDLVNVACTSKINYTLLKPLLWKAVKLPIIRFSECGAPAYVFDNLKYTYALNLYEEYDIDVVVDDDDNNDSIVENSMKKALDAGIHLSRVVCSCDPSKVNELTLKDVTAGVVVHSLEVLCHIKVLTLRQCSNIKWADLALLKNLKELKLFDCNISDEDLANVVQDDQFESLHIHNCVKLTSKALQHISLLNSLRKLDYFRTFNEDALAVRCISRLENLTHLRIGCDSNEALVHLCCCLTNLKELTLTKSQISDYGLRKVNQLLCLSKLVLHCCPLLTSKCLDYISSVPCLRFFAFEATLCFKGDGVEKLRCLNRIVSLKEIDITSKPENLAGILKSLCHGKSWRLRYTPIEVARSHHIVDHYILSC